MQQNAERQADDDAHHGQNDIFTEHIRAGFPGMEAEHLDGGNFPDAFGQIDVAEVKQDDERECAGGNEHERDDIVEALHHLVDHIARIGDDGNGGYAVRFGECGGKRIFVCAVVYAQQERFRLVALIGDHGVRFARHVEVILHVVFN